MSRMTDGCAAVWRRMASTRGEGGTRRRRCCGRCRCHRMDPIADETSGRGRVGGRDKAVSAGSGGRARSDVVRRNGSRRSATMWVCVEVTMAPRFGPLCLLPLSPPWLEAVSRWASRAAEQQVAGSRQQAAGSKQQQAPMEPPRPGRPAARQREADGQSQTAEPETRAKGGGIGTVKKKCAKIDWTRQTQRGLALPALQFARLC